ncbi:MAG: MGMT family protein [Candidatus Leucobacter sulfamidivorax]|nr:MGMT family protein [Candidatus Leucobacter sulfamidivorax]
MPSPEFVDAVLDVVVRIPAGRVVTYGDVAWAIGSEAPRAVGRVMALYGHAVPWWRVVRASGEPPHGPRACPSPLPRGETRCAARSCPTSTASRSRPLA